MIYTPLVISLGMVGSSSSLWTMWLGLEMYNFSLIPWLYKQSSKISKDKIFKYFIIQMVSSSLFLMGVLLEISSSLLVISMVMKLGGFPFHMWVVIMLENMSWKKLEILLTLSKMTGLLIMSMINPTLSSLSPYMLGVLTPLGGLKEMSVRKLFSLSSISHLSWMFMIICQSPSLTLIYFLSYWLVLSVGCKFMYMLNIHSLKDLMMPSSMKLSGTILMIVLMGFPPFFGFVPKFLTIKLMAESSYIILLLFMCVSSIFPMYMYIKLFLNLFTSVNHWNMSFTYMKESANFLMMFEFILILGLNFMVLYWI
uniref:NADH-ubiquinone oxidoreductase chain 2 n=1 Tax=Eomenopon denticulatum TaxID=2965267 RepID=A0A9Y2DXP1_9NEOP|nr:NADH dehydrogenase subunit 2 [Eomenopon denticulatum]WIM51549.1 NADH dehydrogenase subunit 2 [Eomenopon denticulatum]